MPNKEHYQITINFSTASGFGEVGDTEYENRCAKIKADFLMTLLKLGIVVMTDRVTFSIGRDYDNGLD